MASRGALSFFYENLFPFDLLQRWLTVGRHDFSNREFSLAVRKSDGDDMIIRWLSFKDGKDLKKKMLSMEYMPHKLDIGGVYSYPVGEKDVRGALFHPVERELVLDIDMDDYDEIRTCCKGKAVCGKCWAFVRLAIKLLDCSLREDFGFRSIVWVFSGRRGVHCWVGDEAARQLSAVSRSALIEYLSLVKGSDKQKKKVILPFNQPVHPMVRRSYRTCLKAFTELVTEQNFFSRQGGDTLPAQGYIPDKHMKDFKRSLETKQWNGTSLHYWELLQRFFGPSNPHGASDHILIEIVLSFSYPRLDVNVSKDLQHLLKSPFCVHEATGKVCVPIPPTQVDSFDPSTVPTIATLWGELNSGGGATGLRPYLEFFEKATEDAARRTAAPADQDCACSAEECNMEKTAKRPRLSPPPYEVEQFTTVEDDTSWKLHESRDWLFHPEDEAYFHLPTQRIWKRADATNEFAPVEATPDDEEAEAAAAAAEAASDSDSSIELDVDRVLKCHSATLKGTYPGKELNEDRHIVKEMVPLDVLSGCEACCFVSAVFDGHGGSKCVDYCRDHLLTNITASYRQIASTLERKREAFSQRPDVQARPERLRHYLGFTNSVHFESLIRAIRKGFEITDRNYQEMARRQSLSDGSTALMIFFYGPDDDGLMKIITAHVGDCRAVMCTNEAAATRLTKDHKPNRPDEEARVVKCGGQVVQVRGVWRVVVDSTPVPVGLAVARAIGDAQMKPCVSGEPEVNVYPLQLVDECFVLLASDGIWDVFTDEEAVEFIKSRLLERREGGEAVTEALNELLEEAKTRGSMDDKTAVLVVFDLESSWGVTAVEGIECEGQENREELEEAETERENELDPDESTDFHSPDEEDQIRASDRADGVDIFGT